MNLPNQTDKITNWRQLDPVMNRARLLDIATNPDPLAIFEAGGSGFQVWCTPTDHPDCDVWRQKADQMTIGAFSKHCAYVGSVYFEWDEEMTEIVAIRVSTDAYHIEDELRRRALAEHGKRTKSGYMAVTGAGYKAARRAHHNRFRDIDWVKEKVAWLWRISEITLPMPPIEVDQ